MKDIYLKLYCNNNWELYNQGSLEMCYFSQIKYMDLFKRVQNYILNEDSKTLIVGGGDQNILNVVSNILTKNCTLLLTDPNASLYNNLQKVISYSEYNSNLLYDNKFSYTFNEFYKKFYFFHGDNLDNIIVDCSESKVIETKEIYCELFFKKCHSLLTEGGIIIMYIPENSIKESFYNSYFKLETEVTTYISEWEEEAKFIVLRKTDNE